MTLPIKPELLAPAGDWDCARAAVANGADAIYFGLPAFNARLRATNFSSEDLPKLMDYLHDHGVKGYVTFNVLIFTDELERAQEQLLWLHQCGVDAALVQDVGLAQLSHELVPDLHIHASTQMTLTSPEGVTFASRLGIRRVVLARETSLRELAKFEQPLTLPLEVFVHGALCVAYSGQCLTSEALGQRSANRGECAQACRLPYEMVVDGVTKDLGDKKYLLSPQDLAAVDEIPELMRLGISSFKIEGRLKTPEYVAAVSQVYRKAIDAAWEKQSAALTPEDKYRLEMAFSRGLYSGWMHGVNHQQLVHARFGKKRGAFLGLITQVGRDYIELKSETEIKPGDGIVFDTGEDTDQEQGGRVYEIRGNRLYFQHGKIDFSALREGHRVWKTDDPQLNRELRKSYTAPTETLKQPLTLVVSGQSGMPLKIVGRSHGAEVQVESTMPLQIAAKQPLDEKTLTKQLSRLGETPYELGDLKINLQGAVIIPVSELNRMRRDLVTELMTKREKKVAPMQPKKILDRMLTAIAVTPAPAPATTSLIALCRSEEQITVALETGVNEIYADFEDIRCYKDAVFLVRGKPQTKIFLATPRIQKTGETGFFRLIESFEPDGVLIRNLGALDYFRERPLIKRGDFSLNVANPLSAAVMIKEGLERLTVSYDLNIDQVLALLRQAPPAWFELTLHQHIPMFHMEHCVFAAFLSEGTDHTNCGRPCDTHQLELRDRVGALHPVKADVGCRNTVFQSRAQSGAFYFDAFYRAGLRAFRLELLNENAVEAEKTIRHYQQLLSGILKGPQVIDALRVNNQLGITHGPLDVHPA